MELEKLKEIWTTLDNRMQQQEVLKTTIIKEMLVSKSDKALSRLINYSYLGIITLLIGIPFFIWLSSAIKVFDFIKSIFIPVMIMFLLIGLIFSIIQLIKLHKFSFSKTINQNIHLIQKLNTFNKRYYIISMVILFLFTFISLTIVFISYAAYIAYWRWIAMIAILIAGVFLCFWEYKRMYRRNFNSILKSLEELKELEETEDNPG